MSPDPINFSLQPSAPRSGASLQGPLLSPKGAEAGPGIAGDALKLSIRNIVKNQEDARELPPEAYGPELPEPVQEKRKLSLGFNLNDQTRITFKPSLSHGGKLRIEIKSKF